MVEPISSSIARPKIARPGEDVGLPIAGSGASASATAVASPSGDSVSLSAAAQAMPAELNGGPPIDTDTVKRIKDAIAEGNYPINLDAIMESLFENYVELVG